MTGELLRLEQAESDFDRNLGWKGLAARADGGAELPLADGFNGLFVEAEAGALDHLNVGGAAIQSDDHHQHNYALILGFAGFVGILRVRAVDAAGHADTIDASAESAAAGAATFARA